MAVTSPPALSAPLAWRATPAELQAHEAGWPRDPQADPARWGVRHGDAPPCNRLRGPVHPRGPPSGVTRRHGRDIAACGEPGSADLTSSDARASLALLAGVAMRQGRLQGLHKPVAAIVPGIGFDDRPRRKVSWDTTPALHIGSQARRRVGWWRQQGEGLAGQLTEHRRSGARMLPVQRDVHAGQQPDQRRCARHGKLSAP